MRLRAIHLLYAALAIAVVVWLVGRLGDSDERALQRAVGELGSLIAKEEGEGNATALRKAMALGDRLAQEFEIVLDQFGVVVSDRRELQRVMLAYRSGYGAIEVRAEDPEIEVDGAAGQAEVEVTYRLSGSRAGGNARQRYRLRLDWQKDGGDWLLRAIELLESDDVLPFL